MKNLKMTVSKDKLLTITVDLNERLGRSASGKTIMIASSEGNQPIPGAPECVIGLNVYTK